MAMTSTTSKPSPLVFPAFNNEDGNASPKQFLDFLRNLTSQYLSSASSVKGYSKDTWMTIMVSLTDGILPNFPIPEAMAWNTMAEKINLVDAIVDIIYRVFTQVNGIYQDSKVSVKKVFSRLLDICFVLDLWLEVDVFPENDLPSPSLLRDKVMRTLLEVLRGLGNTLAPSEVQESRNMLRQIISEVVEVIHALTPTTASFSFPIAIKWFSSERILELKDDPALDSKEEEACSIILDAPSQVPVLLATSSELLFSLFSPGLSAEFFLADIQRPFMECAKSLFDYYLGSSSSASSNRRSRILSRLLQVQTVHGIALQKPILYLQERLIQSRLQGLLQQDTAIIDSALKQSLEARHVHPTRAIVIQAFSHLKVREGSNQDVDLRSLSASYLRSCLSEADEDMLLLISQELEQCSNHERTALSAEITRLRSTAATLVPASSTVSSKLNMKDHVWRRQIQQLVQDIIAPESVTWMDDDFRPNESHTIRRVLNDVADRFSRPLLAGDPHSRITLSEQLAQLPCLLALCANKDCVSFSKSGAPKTVERYLPLVESLLDGPAEEVTPAVRRSVYSTFCFILRHRTEEDAGQQAMDMVFKGLVDKDRSTRLRAGSALHAVVQVYAAKNEDPRNGAIAVFDRIYQLIEVNKSPIRETVIISVGSMGRTSKTVILGHVLCLLVAQLGRENILIRSLACTQIISIAKYHKKTPYSLMLPSMDQVAPFVINRLSKQAALLSEICRLVSISPVDFISINLSRTLPELLVRCDSKGLDFVANQLGKPRHTLIVGDNIHTNLAPIFLLSTSAQTNKALKFVLAILNEASNSEINLQQLLPGCTTALLTELVVVMGDESPSVMAMARSAVGKVETALKVGKSVASQETNPGAFLGSQMLGIISRIIDMLQDVHGKKSVVAKQKILRSLGALITLIGPPIHSVSSQIMATFQTMVSVPELSEVTLESWHKFLTTLGTPELGPHLGPACAAFVSSWPNLSERSHQIIVESLHSTFSRFGQDIVQHLDEIVDLSIVQDLIPLQAHLVQLRGPLSSKEVLQRLLDRCSNKNITVAALSLAELKKAMQFEHRTYVQNLASGDVFDPAVGKILSTLLAAACRDGDGTENLRLLAYECIGVLGAVDPYRFEIGAQDVDMVVSKNFTDEGETVHFVLHLIQDLLVDTFRSTSDIKYQTNLAYPIQELLKYCGFSSDIVNSGRTVGVKIRSRWNSLSKDVLDVITPLLEGRFTFNQYSAPNIQLPIYPTQSTYREWLQLWTTHLISKASGPQARRIFGVFLSVVRSKDVVIARHILPHLVLNILISGDMEDAEDILKEIMVVLRDQVDGESSSTTDKKLLSAQAIFALLDHLNKWARVVRRETSSKRAESKRARPNQIQSQVEEQLLRLDSIISSIDQNLMARAAFQCKAYARSLMSFEQQIVTLSQQSNKNLQEHYDKVHEIYAHLDEPDGMEGVSTRILSPSLEHQIREHESIGRWTAAQSCWEVRLQQSPDNLDFHLGLLRCLRNLGHYDTLRNHVKGVLTHHPEWEPELADFHVESSWMVGAWDDVNALVQRVDARTPSIVLAKVLLALRNSDGEDISVALATARNSLGAPISASGANGYRRSYDAVLNLHITHELETIYSIARSLPSSSTKRRQTLSGLSEMLSSRLNSTLPNFKNREPILSMRRIGFSILPTPHPALVKEVGSSWLASAKVARKAGHWQTAYSAMLQARQNNSPFYFIESAKLVKVAGEPLRALQELETFMKSLGLSEDPAVVDLSLDEEMTKMKVKLSLLRARWMNESERYEATAILEAFRETSDLDKKWESSHFYFGNFYDACCKELKPADHVKRGLKMNMYTVRNYARAIRYGTKYIYHTVPRLLTLWLDNGEHKDVCGTDVFNKMNELVASAIREVPAYKWYTAFPQIVSRVGHTVDKVYTLLSQLIVTILQEYPRQSLWLFASVMKSTKATRESRGRAILEKLRSTPSSNRKLPKFVADSVSMTNELLALCDRVVDDDRKTLSMSKDFPKLRALGRSDLLIPLQESLTVNLPSTSSSAATHQPFPLDAPTFQEFADEIEIMRSMAKPRKITIRGSDGQIYMFLGKPKDDLRKDARLMDFNSIINKLLKTNSDARRRQLHIRTYGVVTLNEECGFIQWVPNTIPVRPVLLKYYDARRVKSWSGEMDGIFKKIKELPDPQAGALFVSKILPMFPPVFHEWFIETFPEPTAWLASRLNYGRTAAVMSMVGYILGLGDRHCENILLDVNTGDVVHVDFNCLFEKGKTLDTPERVPFRLTQNIVDGLGITGVEGVFRISCDLTMTVLRENKDSLMSVLDAFIHDPLVEWEDEKRKMDRHRNQPKTSTANIAKTALDKITKKLEGIYTIYKSKHEEIEKSLSTTNLVEVLIQEATSDHNLAKMYPGWAPWN